MKDLMSGRVYQAIEDQLRDGSRLGESGWEAGSDEEDTLTGHWGARLQRPWQEIEDEFGQAWKWRVTYTKFRGQGKCADEKELGADGIVEISVDDRRKVKKVVKGLLFQAKKTGSAGKKKLMEQAGRMESVIPNGCAVFE